MSILKHPSWYLSTSSSTNNCSLKEFPFFISEHLREYSFDEMESIGKSIGLEKGSANLGEAKFDQTI
jgi:hypothetical protein